MSFRTRILYATLAVALIALIVFAVGARREVRNLLRNQYQSRVDASRKEIIDDLEQQRESLDRRIRSLADRIDDIPEQRAALLGTGDRSVLINYAAAVAPTADFDYLLLLDSAGSVLSSGHFRNEFDRRLNSSAALLAATGPVLVAARRPEGQFLALVRAYSFDVGDARFTMAGGVEVDSALLSSLARTADSTVVVTLDYPGGVLLSDAIPRDAARSKPIDLTFINDVAGTAAQDTAHWTIAHSMAPLRRVQRALDTWFLIAVAAAVVLAVLVARVFAARVNQPLEELAEKTQRVNLERLDVDFATDRSDEIGSLSRLLNAMMKRLRLSATQLRDAERRATVGEMARQVNHDIRNGLLPIRNVIQHLGEVARDHPAELNSVFTERQETLQSGIGYLESLATSYARLTPRSERRPCDVNAVVRAVMRDVATADTVQVRLELSEVAPRVMADPVALRRTIENLTVNAAESMENSAGTITVRTSIDRTAPDRRVNITVSDTGTGIEPALLDRIFDDFYTTKDRGSGLGLSIVRRLVADMGGRIHVQSEPGRGTTFRIELPETS